MQCLAYFVHASDRSAKSENVRLKKLKLATESSIQVKKLFFASFTASQILKGNKTTPIFFLPKFIQYLMALFPFYWEVFEISP